MDYDGLQSLNNYNDDDDDDDDIEDSVCMVLY